MSTRIAVVGAGMAAARFAERYRFLGGTAEVTLYGAEPRAPYNRVLLAEVLAGHYDAEAIALQTGGAQLRLGEEVVAIDTEARELTLGNGEAASWDALVLATGANPVLPPIRGLHPPLAGVHALRSLADCRRLAEDAATAARVVVIGGGVLGVSAARALAATGPAVEIVHQAPHLIERHLDADAAEALRRGLREVGVDVYTRNRAKALHGSDDGRVTGVELANGYVLSCDLVVLACGVRPRTGLAHAAGLAVERGVLVDDELRTSAPDVFAVGDCTEHRGAVHGLAGPAWEQADVLAALLSGADREARYTGSRPLARLSAGSLEYAAFGLVDESDDPELDVLTLSDATRGAYKKLVLRGDRLVGGILLGDLATVDALTRAYERDEPLPDSPLHLLTTLPAR